MASTYSDRLRLELIGTGEQSGTWGATTNTNLGTLLDQAIAGMASITMTDANYTLSNLNGSSDEARRIILKVGGQTQHLGMSSAQPRKSSTPFTTTPRAAFPSFLRPRAAQGLRSPTATQRLSGVTEPTAFLPMTITAFPRGQLLTTYQVS
jgi:hypothetical protein